MTVAAFVKYFPYVLSLATVYMTLLQGRKEPSSWVIGLINQVGWTTWILLSGNYGFLLLNAALWILYARNYMLWKYDLDLWTSMRNAVKRKLESL